MISTPRVRVIVLKTCKLLIPRIDGKIRPIRYYINKGPYRILKAIIEIEYEKTNYPSEMEVVHYCDNTFNIQ